MNTVKNLVISILIVIVAGLSTLLYRATRVPPDIFVTGMTTAVEKQSQVCSDLASQVLWLRRHLEKTLNVLETERDLDPIPVQTPYSLKRETYPSEYVREPDSFVTPYQKPEHRPLDADLSEHGLLRLEALIGLNVQSVLLATAETEFLIDNFYQRLQRLESKIERD